MKRLALSAGVCLLLIYLFFFPTEALAASRNGLGLWLNTLLPTLLPFLILSNLLIRSGAAERLMQPFLPFFRRALGLGACGSYVFLLGMLCGYPMGAKLTGDFYRAGRLSRKEALYLLTFANTASPMFLRTYLVLTTLRAPSLLVPTFLFLYGADFLCCLCTGFFYRIRRTAFPCEAAADSKEAPSHTTDAWIDASILNGFETMTKLGGYILLFSIAAAALNTVWPQNPPLKYLLLCLTELSTGLHLLRSADLPFFLCYLIALAGSSFGGLCVLAQTGSVLAGSGLPLTPYLAGKTLHLFFTVLLLLFFAQIV